MGCKPDQTPEEERQQPFSDLSAEISRVITDSGRRQKALALAKEFQGVFEGIRKQRADSAKELGALNRDYDAPKSTYTAYFQKVDKRLQANFKLIADIHARVTSNATADEWKQLVDAHSDAMDFALNTLRSS